ncbi:MAG: hypothetical protein FWD13_11810 [Treponema sp.]|nr:hypothetical protein [Treponema sp.]
MKKILFLFFCGFILCNTILYAQPAQRHSVSASPGLRLGGSSFAWIAAELRYEYMFNSSFSAGAYFYYEDSFGIGITGRWYPFSKSFFLELGTGYNRNFSTGGYLDEDTGQWVNYRGTNGFDLIYGFGWKINIGKPGGLFITPNVKLPTIFSWHDNPNRDNPFISTIFIGYFGVGYAF